MTESRSTIDLKLLLVTSCRWLPVDHRKLDPSATRNRDDGERQKSSCNLQTVTGWDAREADS